MSIKFSITRDLIKKNNKYKKIKNFYIIYQKKFFKIQNFSILGTERESQQKFKIIVWKL